MKTEMEMEIISDGISWRKDEYELGHFEIEFKFLYILYLYLTIFFGLVLLFVSWWCTSLRPRRSMQDQVQLTDLKDFFIIIF